jgi:hypothetical protein
VWLRKSVCGGFSHLPEHDGSYTTSWDATLFPQCPHTWARGQGAEPGFVQALGSAGVLLHRHDQERKAISAERRLAAYRRETRLYPVGMPTTSADFPPSPSTKNTSTIRASGLKAMISVPANRRRLASGWALNERY